MIRDIGHWKYSGEDVIAIGSRRKQKRPNEVMNLVNFWDLRDILF